ncbi:MAG: YjjG family noncanonical pyrimidine nucleotidase [Bacteroidia bacterium]
MVDLKEVKHIFFDLDDTLWDFESNSKEALHKLFSEFELNQYLKTDFDTFLIAYKKVNAYLWTLYHKDKITKEDLRFKRFHDTFLDFGYRNEEKAISFSDGYIATSPHGTKLKKGAVELLNKASEKYKLHIITNGFKEVQYLKLTNCGIRNYFDNVLVSEEVGFNKPDKRLFLKAQELCNTESTNCLMIGDNYDTDIQGAKKAGWQSLWYNPYQVKRFQGKQIQCLTEFTNIL